MNTKDKALELIKSHTLYQGDDGALGEYWTDTLEAKKHALITINACIEALDIHQWQNRNEIDYWKEVKLNLEEL